MKRERMRFRVTPYVCSRGHVQLVVSPDQPSVNCQVGVCLEADTDAQIVQAGPPQPVEVIMTVPAGTKIIVGSTFLNTFLKRTK
jgi:hypothetical protein